MTSDPTRRRGVIAFRLLAGLAPVLALTSASSARAEIIELLDKTKMHAKLVHFYDGVFSFESGGQTVKIPREKVKSIQFDLPKARPEFSTAEKTFERWKKAMQDGDLEKVIDCYALMYQGMLAMQMGGGQATDAVKKMQKELEGMKFSVKGSSAKGDSATLKVLRQKGDESETHDVGFVRENGEWKMLPMQ
jgi:hypothetical protein